jgi:hypothetical protein
MVNKQDVRFEKKSKDTAFTQQPTPPYSTAPTFFYFLKLSLISLLIVKTNKGKKQLQRNNLMTGALE